jgi:hypothetical protein
MVEKGLFESQFLILFKTVQQNRAGRMTQEEECLSSKHEALSTTKKKKGKIVQLQIDR